LSAAELTAIILSGLSILFTVIKLFRHPHWSIRLFDFPQVQILVIGILVLILDVIVFDFSTWYHWGLSAAVLASVVYESYIIIPYSPLYPKQVKSIGESNNEHISILVSNVYMNNRDYGLLKNKIYELQPHILITLESDEGWQEALSEIESDYTYKARIPLKNMYGMHVYSRLPLEKMRVRYLIEDDVPSVTSEVRLPSGRRFVLYAVHPKPPSPTENEESLERDGELYLVAKEIKDMDRPIIVAGDLNDVAWSHSTRLFQKLSRLLDPRIGRGFFNTFHADIPVFRWPLDHIFHSEHFKVSRIERLESIGSDHFPMFIDLVVANDQDPAWMPPEPEEEEKEEADETIRTAKLKHA